MSTSLEIKLNLSRTLKTSIFWQSRTPLTSYTLYRRAWHLHVHTFSAFISSQHLTCQPLTPLWLFSPRWDHTAVQTEGFSSHPPGHTHAHTCQHTCTQPTHHPPPPSGIITLLASTHSPFCSQPCASYLSLYSLNSCFPRRVFPHFQVRVHVPSCHPLV